MYSELALELITLNLLESDVYHIKVRRKSDHIMRKDLKKTLPENGAGGCVLSFWLLLPLTMCYFENGSLNGIPQLPSA